MPKIPISHEEDVWLSARTIERSARAIGWGAIAETETRVAYIQSNVRIRQSHGGAEVGRGRRQIGFPSNFGGHRQLVRLRGITI